MSLGTSLRFVTVGTIFMAIPVLSRAQSTAVPPTSVTQSLGVVLTMPDGRNFVVPVSDSQDPAKQMTGIVPLAKGSLVGIRIAPHMDHGLVSIEVSALLGGPSSSGLPFTKVRSWARQEAVGNYTVAANESLPLSELAKFALPPLALKVMTIQGGGEGPDICSGYCCCYGQLKCCPIGGNCINCGCVAICCYGC